MCTSAYNAAGIQFLIDQTQKSETQQNAGEGDRGRESKRVTVPSSGLKEHMGYLLNKLVFQKVVML